MIMEDMLGISGVRVMENMRRRGERKVKGGSIMEQGLSRGGLVMWERLGFKESMRMEVWKRQTEFKERGR